jgi:hypothetical protein
MNSNAKWKSRLLFAADDYAGSSLGNHQLLDVGQTYRRRGKASARLLPLSLAPCRQVGPSEQFRSMSFRDPR